MTRERLTRTLGVFGSEAEFTQERIRIRLGNLSPMDHHSIHIHGLNFGLTATDGGYVPESAQHPDTTVLVPVGSTRVIEFVPPEPGDWAMHFKRIGKKLTSFRCVFLSKTPSVARKLASRFVLSFGLSPSIASAQTVAEESPQSAPH